MVKGEVNKEVMVLLALGLALIISFYLYGEIDWQGQRYSKWDLDKYKAMAEADWVGDAKVKRPFCYRWLGPVLAGFMPFDTVKSFLILDWFFCAAFVYLLYSFLHNQGYRRTTSLTVLLTVIFNKYLFGYFVWNYFQLADVITLVLLVLMFRAMEARSWLWFGVFLALGAATKEPNMLMIPVAWLFIWRRSNSKDKIRLLFCCLAAVAVFVIIRYLTHPGGGIGISRAFVVQSSKLFKAEKLAKMFINIWVPVSFIPVIFPGRTWSFFKKHSYLLLFVLLIYFSSLFGSSTERLLAPAGIVVYWLMADIVENNPHRKELSLLIVGAAVASCWHYEIGRFLLPSQKVMILLSCSALLVTSAVAVYYRFSVREQ